MDFGSVEVFFFNEFWVCGSFLNGVWGRWGFSPQILCPLEFSQWGVGPGGVFSMGFGSIGLFSMGFGSMRVFPMGFGSRGIFPMGFGPRGSFLSGFCVCRRFFFFQRVLGPLQFSRWVLGPTGVFSMGFWVYESFLNGALGPPGVSQWLSARRGSGWRRLRAPPEQQRGSLGRKDGPPLRFGSAPRSGSARRVPPPSVAALFVCPLPGAATVRCAPRLCGFPSPESGYFGI